jgi:hypothetical protein
METSSFLPIVLVLVLVLDFETRSQQRSMIWKTRIDKTNEAPLLSVMKTEHEHD